MPPKGHAVLSASASHRWLNCPPSARLCESYEDKGSDSNGLEFLKIRFEGYTVYNQPICQKYSGLLEIHQTAQR